MIGGIGTDLISIGRIRRVWERHGNRLCAHILSADELHEVAPVRDVPRFLAKRWALKEAFGKAAGTGMRAPIKWSGITVIHDELGRPELKFAPFIQAWLNRRGIDRCHVSVSDEQDMVSAFVVLEGKDGSNVAA